MRLNSPHVNLITKACMKASRSLIRDFGEIENLQVSAKGPGDFVTSADKRTEKILIDELQKAHPDYGIITEESGIINKSNTNNRWIITLSQKEGQESIKQQIHLKKQTLLENEKKNEVYKTVLNLFPDAELIDIEKISKD